MLYEIKKLFSRVNVSLISLYQNGKLLSGTLLLNRKSVYFNNMFGVCDSVRRIRFLEERTNLSVEPTPFVKI